MNSEQFRPWCVIGVSFLMLVGASHVTRAAEVDYQRLLTRIPDDANALVLLNVESIFASSVAQAENWRQTYADNFAASPLIVPPNAQRFVLGAAIEIESMEPLWEVASMNLSTDPSMADIVQRIGGVSDKLSNVEVVWPKDNLCVAKFAPGEFAVLSPASRQAAARWASRAAREQSGGLTPYLQQAARYAEGRGPEIIMAIDLDQILRPEAIRAAVERSDFLRSLDQDQVTRILSSLRGVTLGVRVTDRIHGKLLVDFGEDATLLEPVAQRLVLQVLTTTGAMFDELNGWKSQVQNQRISIEGPLSTEGMRRLFSLVTLDTAVIARQKEPPTKPTPPTPAAKSTEDAETAEESAKEVMASASLRYFRSVERYLSDLQRPRSSSDLADIALWIHNFARKIERLPSFNVDPDLLAFGQSVVYGMRDAVGYLHGIEQRTQERQAEVRPKSNITVGAIPTDRTVSSSRPLPYAAAYPFGAYSAYNGFYRYREYVPFYRANIDIASALEEQDEIAREEYETGTDAARQIMERLQSDMQNIRQTLTQRYGRQF